MSYECLPATRPQPAETTDPFACQEEMHYAGRVKTSFFDRLHGWIMVARLNVTRGVAASIKQSSATTIRTTSIVLTP